MGKFEFEFEVTGLRMKVKGERGDMPLIANNMAKQFGDMFKPVANIVEGPQGQLPFPIDATAVEPAPEPTTKSRKRRPSPRAPRDMSTIAAASSTAKFVPDPASWGNPIQTWSQVDKAIWLLYVAAQVGFAREMIGGEIATVFNAHFREAKMISAKNISRDLTPHKDGPGAMLGRTEALAWFLTEAGKTHATKLVVEAREKVAS